MGRQEPGALSGPPGPLARARVLARVDRRDRRRCRCCDRHVVQTGTVRPDEIERHHLISKGKGHGGAFTFWNLVTLCLDCHGLVERQADSRDPDPARMLLRAVSRATPLTAARLAGQFWRAVGEKVTLRAEHLYLARFLRHDRARRRLNRGAQVSTVSTGSPQSLPPSQSKVLDAALAARHLP